MEKLDYSAFEKEILTILVKNRVSVLSTSYNDHVTTRPMAYVSDGLKIYFQTDKSFMKVEQIKHNPNVAVCVGNLQIEGQSILKGHPLENENKTFARLFKEKNGACFDAFAQLKNTIVIEVEPRLFTIWKTREGKSFRDFLDIQQHKAYREFYNPEPRNN